MSDVCALYSNNVKVRTFGHGADARTANHSLVSDLGLFTVIIYGNCGFAFLPFFGKLQNARKTMSMDGKRGAARGRGM